MSESQVTELLHASVELNNTSQINTKITSKITIKFKHVIILIQFILITTNVQPGLT